MVAKKQDNPVYHSVNEILSQEELPENLRNMNKDKSFMKCILGLKTSPRRKINPKNLVKVYARIEAQKTRFVRLFLKNLGIPSSQLKNISFVGKNICELLVHKNFKNQLIKVLHSCEIKILNDFYPNVCTKEGGEEKEDIMRTELAYYKRISDIINRKNSPEYVKKYYGCPLIL